MYIGKNACVIKGSIIQQMTSDDFFDLCQSNEILNFERDEKGNIILLPPTGSQTSIYNGDILFQLHIYGKNGFYKLIPTFNEKIHASTILPDFVLDLSVLKS